MSETNFLTFFMSSPNCALNGDATGVRHTESAQPWPPWPRRRARGIQELHFQAPALLLLLAFMASRDHLVGLRLGNSELRKLSPRVQDKYIYHIFNNMYQYVIIAYIYIWVNNHIHILKYIHIHIVHMSSVFGVHSRTRGFPTESFFCFWWVAQFFWCLKNGGYPKIVLV